MSVATGTSTIVAMQCGKCGVWFGMDQTIYNSARETGRDFYCTNGHCRVFRKTDLQEERDRAGRLASQLEQARAELESTRASLAAQKGQTTRLRKRVAAGVCPCCNRTFKQLSRHMASQHPEFPAAES